MSEKYLLEQWNFWLDEIYSYSIIKKYILDEWGFTDKKEEAENLSNLEKIKLGERWKKVSLPVYFVKRFKLLENFKNYPLYIHIDVGGEAFLFLNKKPYAGINPYHKDHKIPYQEDYLFLIEAVPKGLFGQNQKNPIFKEAYIYQKDEELYRAWLAFYLIREFGLLLEDTNKELQKRVQNILEETLGKIDVISSHREFIQRIQNTKFTLDLINGLWSQPEFESIEKPIPSDLRESIIHHSQLALRMLSDLKEKYPNLGELYAIGHAHIDYAWLWPREETIRKAQRTFSTILNLMENYPDFVFLQSSAQIYQDIKENNNYLFEKIKERVKEGRWIIEGGTWVENDCQLLCGESFVRQFLYAQKFFEKEFGIRCKLAWLPDTFGFNPNLPQILKKSGIKYFATTKLTWNETNTFPYDLFLWKGIDGTKVIAHIFGKNCGYNGTTEIKEIWKTFNDFQQKDIISSLIYSYGYGDGGGGPTYEMIERLNLLKDFPLIPEIKKENPIDFLEKINEEKLPLYYGDLYLELHRGTFTTQGRIKRLHRMAENHLITIESLSTILNILENISYPKEEIDKNWKKLLRNEFHDILPGSSIKEVYEDTEKELKEILDFKINFPSSAKKDYLLVYNPTSFPQELKFELDTGQNLSLIYKDEILPSQKTYDNKMLFYSKDILIEPFSFITLKISKEEAKKIETDLVVEKNSLENTFLKVEINEDGTIDILYKDLNRKIFKERGNQLFVFPDRPRYWEAWDIPLNYEKFGREIKDVEKIEVLEKGPLRARIKVVKRYKDSKIVQHYTLYSYSKRLDIVSEIEWCERRTMLRAYFPMNILAPIVQYEIPYGIYWKPVHKNTSWEKTQFEIPAHRFIDLSQGDFGVSILNNGKYGHSIDENTIGITLLRSPLTPDYTADVGIHTFTYSILPHLGPLNESTIKEAEELNRPLYIMNLNEYKEEKSLLSWDKRNVILGALKKAEDEEGIILRFVEYLGKEEDVNIKFNISVRKIYETNLLEDTEKEISIENSNLKLHIRPFEIKTIKVIY
ncbi:MAG: glycosyl hydrolase-related protein [Dictyoglomus thermophilum]|nr:glycoside hydrolase family 38 C-terminal domain-containing protein [Dictyoglomus thermophilum]MCX7720515.1 glycosyl hydrolase-related protein [Dictyoglomus thermophilum]